MFDLKNKKVTIIGAARSGVAVADVVLRLGGIAKISESKALEEFSRVLDSGFRRNDSGKGGNDSGKGGNDSGKGGNDSVGDGYDKTQVIVESGGHTQAFIQDSDYVVLSPGVRLDSPPVKWARERGIEVMGEVEFAFRLCPCPVVAITGSNGKTTTSTVIAEILKAAGRSVCLCGNIGSPFSRYVLDLKPTDTVVLEISSFQLESTIHFKPHVAVWTNFSQNHLDRHKDLEEYFQAKCRIFANQDSGDFAVLNFQESNWIPAFAGMTMEEQGMTMEEQGMTMEEQGMTGFIKFTKQLKAKVLFFNEIASSGSALLAMTQPDEVGAIGPFDNTGRVDNPNYLAAMQAARALGISEEVCRKVFSEFKGVEHRLEFVRDLGGVEYINDSKSTTVEAGRWALQRIAKPMVMICGGLDKHLDYSPLKSLVAQKVKHMMAIGQAREIMRSTFGDVVEVDTFTSLEEAVKAARGVAKSGECVLLSPMCASFDMFKDYEHRGRCFKEIVNSLK